MAKEILIAEIPYADRFCEIYRTEDGYFAVFIDEIESIETDVHPALPELLGYVEKRIAEEKKFLLRR